MDLWSLSGKVTRDSKVRVIRDGVVIYDGALASLKHFKDDVKEITNGREGGLMIEGYNDIKTDDTIEAYIMEEIKNKKLTREKEGNPLISLVLNTEQKGVPMASHFRTDRVGMEIKREVNVILQRKSVTRVFKASPLRMFKC